MTKQQAEFLKKEVGPGSDIDILIISSKLKSRAAKSQMAVTAMTHGSGVRHMSVSS